MSKKDLEHFVGVMNREAEARSLDIGVSHDKATLMVLRQHIAVIESRLVGVEEILVAVSESMGELWWTAGTVAKQKITEVETLVKKLREART